MITGKSLPSLSRDSLVHQAGLIPARLTGTGGTDKGSGGLGANPDFNMCCTTQGKFPNSSVPPVPHLQMGVMTLHLLHRVILRMEDHNEGYSTMRGSAHLQRMLVDANLVYRVLSTGPGNMLQYSTCTSSAGSQSPFQGRCYLHVTDSGKSRSKE